MGFTIRFLILFFGMLVHAAPILLFLLAVVLFLAQKIGKRESWKRFDTIYFAFITATTVGYGDFRPTSRRSRMFAIIIALTGLVATGLMVALAMQAVTTAFHDTQAGKPFIEVFWTIMNAG